MSRNDERTNAPVIETGEVEQTPQSLSLNPQEVNMSMYMAPTFLVELPSQGRFYPKNHPLHKVETLEVREMTAKEEDILTNKQLRKKGVALDRVLSSVIVNKAVDVSTLLLGDKSAILVETRINGLGNEYGVKTQCRACSHINEVHYDLEQWKPQPVVDEVMSARRLPDGSGDFTMTLPKSGFEVQCRLMRGIDQTHITQTAEMRRKNKMMETPTVDLLKKIIVAVNGNTNKGDISMFVENGLGTLDSRELKSTYAKMNPEIDMTVTYKCDQCDFYNHIDVPMTSDFFWPSNK